MLDTRTQIINKFESLGTYLLNTMSTSSKKKKKILWANLNKLLVASNMHMHTPHNPMELPLHAPPFKTALDVANNPDL